MVIVMSKKQKVVSQKVVSNEPSAAIAQQDRVVEAKPARKSSTPVAKVAVQDFCKDQGFGTELSDAVALLAKKQSGQAEVDSLNKAVSILRKVAKGQTLDGLVSARKRYDYSPLRFIRDYGLGFEKGYVINELSALIRRNRVNMDGFAEAVNALAAYARNKQALLAK